MRHPAGVERTGRIITGVALALSLTGPMVAADDLELSFDAGRVTLIARDVPMSVVLDEWSRLGHTTFVDAEALAETSVHLHLEDVPEADALRLVLRAAAGYIAWPRREGADGASRFGTVMVMAQSERAAQASSYSPPVGHPASPAARGRGPRVVSPVGGAGTASESDALEALRELLPQPPDRPGTAGAGADGASDPVTAPRPGMPLGAAEEAAPVFIRPVAPQPDDRD